MPPAKFLPTTVPTLNTGGNDDLEHANLKWPVYSVSNCQDGLRGISFGNFLIKQVVEELQAEFPQLKRFCSKFEPMRGARTRATERR